MKNNIEDEGELGLNTQKQLPSMNFSSKNQISSFNNYDNQSFSSIPNPNSRNMQGISMNSNIPYSHS